MTEKIRPNKKVTLTLKVITNKVIGTTGKNSWSARNTCANQFNDVFCFLSEIRIFGGFGYFTYFVSGDHFSLLKIKWVTLIGQTHLKKFLQGAAQRVKGTLSIK